MVFTPQAIGYNGPATSYYFPTISGKADIDKLCHQALLNPQPDHDLDIADGLEHLQDGFPTLFSTNKKVLEILQPLKGLLDRCDIAIKSVLSGRHMFLTSHQLLGIGSQGVLPGDEVMVPEGSQTPFIYRPPAAVDEPDDQRGCVRSGQLIGEYYVHGLMNGEAVEQLKANYNDLHTEGCSDLKLELATHWA